MCMARGEVKGQKRNKRSELYKRIPACFESPTWAIPPGAVEQGRSTQRQAHCSRHTRAAALMYQLQWACSRMLLLGSNFTRGSQASWLVYMCPDQRHVHVSASKDSGQHRLHRPVAANGWQMQTPGQAVLLLPCLATSNGSVPTTSIGSPPALHSTGPDPT